MCTNPKFIRVSSLLLGLYNDFYPYKEIQVPCGVCAECLSMIKGDFESDVVDKFSDVY